VFDAQNQIQNPISKLSLIFLLQTLAISALLAMTYIISGHPGEKPLLDIVTQVPIEQILQQIKTPLEKLQIIHNRLKTENACLKSTDRGRLVKEYLPAVLLFFCSIGVSMPATFSVFGRSTMRIALNTGVTEISRLISLPVYVKYLRATGDMAEQVLKDIENDLNKQYTYIQAAHRLIRQPIAVRRPVQP